MQCRPEMPPGCPCPERDEVTVETTVNPARLPRSRLCAFDYDDDDDDDDYYYYALYAFRQSTIRIALFTMVLHRDKKA